MSDTEKPNQSPQPERWRGIAAVVGMVLIGPVFLGFVISQFLAGKLAGQHPVTAEEHPILFYVILSALGFGAFKTMQLSLLFIVGRFRERSKQ